MKDYGLVSIILPVYNAARFIAETILSVLSQTYPHWELLVIDDFSTDESATIIQYYVQQDRRIKYFKTEKPSGSPFLPRNIGIANAKGRYIAFLDSDDAWLCDKLEMQLNMFERYDDMAICYCNYEKMDESGERNGRIVKAPEAVTYRQLLAGNVIGCLTAVYDTAKVEKVYFLNHAHEDYIMWLSILKRGYVARNTNVVAALYRVCENSVSSNKLKTMLWQWSIYRQVENLGYLKSAFFFISYAYKAFKKLLI